MKNGRTLNSISLFIVPLVMFVSSFAANVIGQDSDSPNDTHYDAVIKSEAAECRISPKGQVSYSYKSTRVIRHKDGDSYAIINLQESSFIKIKKFKGTVFDAAGKKVRSIGTGDNIKVCGFSGFALYADNCDYYYDLSNSTYPYSIGYEYEIETKSPFFWPSWSPQLTIPVEHTTYTLIIPSDFFYSTKATGDMPEPTITENGDKKTVYYELNDVPPAKWEPYLYDAGSFLGGIEFSPHTLLLGNYEITGGNWFGFGRDCYAMMKNCLLTSAEQKALMAELTSDGPDAREVCRRLHESITRNTRYVAIEIGVGSWQPTPSNETFERGYGDCKDLANLYSSMLNDAGIATRMVLILTKHAGLIDPEFPTMQFNHVIFFADIDGDTVWVDATCPYCEIGDLPWGDEDTYVLTIDSSGGALIKTPRSEPLDNAFVRKATVSLFGGRAADVVCNLSAVGNSEHMLQGYLHYSDYDKIESFLQESDFGVSKKTRCTNIDIAQGADPRITATGKIKSAVQSVKEKNFVSLDFFEPLRDRESVKLDSRKYALDLQYPVAYIDSIFINIPKDWKPDSLPEPVRYQDDFGTLSIDYTLAEEKVIIAIVRTNNRYYIPVDEMKSFGEYTRNVKNLYPSHFTFISQ